MSEISWFGATFLTILLLGTFYMVNELNPATGAGGSFGGGTGTIDDPFLIEDIYDLQMVDDDLTRHFALANDIDATMTVSWDGGKGFLPIGYPYSVFLGSLEGRGHMITGLHIDRPSRQMMGMFANLGDGCRIANLTIVDANITGKYYVGAVAAMNAGTIFNVDVEGFVRTNSSYEEGMDVGGLVGDNSGTISCSSAEVEVNGSNKVGGLIGYNSGTVQDCSTTAIVVGNDTVGGLAGSNSGLILNSTANGTVIGGRGVGGFVGSNIHYLINSTSSCQVTGTSELGGLVGYTIQDPNYFHYTEIWKIVNSFYDHEEVSINGRHLITIGALFHEQYLDWIDNGRELNIDDYSEELIPSNGRYGISDADGMRSLLGFSNDPEYKFYLLDDVDLASVEGFWVPYIQGEFDGNGRSISNLDLDQSENNVLGLFGFCEGPVSNLTLTGISVKGGLIVGGLAGVNSKKVANVHVAGAIEASWAIGGMVGYNRGSMVDSSSNVQAIGEWTVGGLCGYNQNEIENCTSSGSTTGTIFIGGICGRNVRDVINCESTQRVDGYSHVGGLNGFNDGDTVRCSQTGEVSGRHHIGGLAGTNRYYLTDSFFEGKITGDSFLGGICGENNGTVRDCISKGSINGNYSAGGAVGLNYNGAIYSTNFSGKVYGNKKVGGLVGSNWNYVYRSHTDSSVDGIDSVGGLIGYNEGDVRESYFDGNVAGSVIVGGLVGFHRGDEITDCYSIGPVTGESYVGGLVGSHYSGASVDNCYAAGGVQGNDAVGGLVGYSTGVVRECYWDKQATGQAGSSGGTGMSTVEMMTRSTYSTWNFHSVWGILNGFTYPLLRYQDDEGPVANAGLDQIVQSGRKVVLNGSLSRDNFGMLGYEWSYYDGDMSVVRRGAVVELVLWGLGNHTVTLNVTDPMGFWDIDTVSINVFDLTWPVADAGRDEVVDEDTPFRFDGSGSFDDSGLPSFVWTFCERSKLGPLIGVRPNHTFRDPGRYNVTLNVSDPSGNFDTDSVLIIVRDITPPVSEAGPNRTIDPGTLIQFDGSLSYDNVDLLNYTWGLFDGTEVVLYGVDPSYRFERPGVYKVTLTVTDSYFRYDEDAMFVTVVDLIAPFADAGFDMIVDEDQITAFDGSMSYDNSVIIGFLWTFEDGEKDVALTGPRPTYIFETPGRFVVRLVATDASDLADNDTINVTVRDATDPLSKAGDDVNVTEGEKVVFHGNESADNVGIVNYTWSFDLGEGRVVLFGPEPSYVFRESGIYIVTLRVMDAGGNHQTDTMIVIVSEKGGSIPLLWYFLGGVIVVSTIAALTFFYLGRRKRKEWEE